MQLISQNNSQATFGDVSHAMFVDVSQLQYAEPLQRPTPTSVPVTSAPMPTHRIPLPGTSDAEWKQAIIWATIAD